jgi:DNA-binding HxlR family transcriptional regulator
LVDQKLDPTARRPIMALLELLGRRWALRILWELRDRPLNSRALRAAAEISPTVLQSRVNELREAGIVIHLAGEGYALTPLGREMLEAFAPLYRFADKWASVQISHTRPDV